MKTGILLMTWLLACLVFALPGAAAQPALNEGQGHPLKGTWLGDWGTDQTKRHPVLIEMNWDGKAVTGSIDPGPQAIRFTSAELKPADWSVHIEAQSRGVRYVIDGKIQNLGSLSRSIVGTWMQGTEKGDFKLTRH